MRQWLLLAVLPGLVTVLAAAEESTTTTTAPAAVEERTEVHGAIPESLVGRWLAVGDVRLPSGDQRSFARLLEVTSRGGSLEVRAYRHYLPGKMEQQVELAGSGGRPPWIPTPGDRQVIEAAWPTLAPVPQDLTGAQNILYGADAYPADLQKDEVTRGSRFTIALRDQFAGANRVVSSYTLYAVRTEEPGVLRGDFVTTSIAAVPLPIPITLKGTFTAYRLGALPAPRSFWQRLADLFAGCGRR